MARPTFAEIDIEAFKHNWHLVQKVRKRDLLIPVIKANAYGHGAVSLSSILQQEGASGVAVALFEEAVQVRESGFSGDIFILGPFDEKDISLCHRLCFTPIVGDRGFLESLVKASFDGPIHIKWDTGMHRLGLAEEEIPWLQDFLRQHIQLKVEAFCTHFLKGDDHGQAGGHTERQYQSFRKIQESFPALTKSHVFNSDSLLAEGEKRLWSDSLGGRPGLCLYGFSATQNEWSQKLRPVMTLKTKIVHLLQIRPGETVSYNATWKAPRQSRIAVLPIGYADGYPRNLSNKGQVFVRGQLVPLVGTVCMDYIMIDVTDVTSVQCGDDVELWGTHISLYSVAQWAETIPYELMTGLTARVPRRLK